MKRPAGGLQQGGLACRRPLACYLWAMSDPSLTDALARLDRAVSRLERIEPSPPAPTAGIAMAYAELDERHGLLRLRIQETIERLDALIDQEATGA